MAIAHVTIWVRWAKKINRKYHFSRRQKENPWSEDETNTGTTTEANEPIEVYDDVSHEASEKKESFRPIGPVYTRG